MGKTSDELDQELEDLLAEGVEGARRREATRFDELAGLNTNELVLFGAGNLGRRTLAGLRTIGIEPLCFIDNDSAKWGQNLNGLTVISPKEGARLYGSRAIFVVTIWYGEASETMASRVAQLRELNCTSVVPFVPLYWKFTSALLPRYMVDCPHRVHLQADRVRQGISLMEDDDSRHEYLAQLRFRLLGDFDCISAAVPGDIYFREDMFSLGKDETFVDCGAFDGDTLALFLDRTENSFKRVIGFEPDPVNFARLVERVNGFPVEVRQHITLHQVATGQSNGRVFMDVGNGLASRVGCGVHEIECVTLDSMLEQVPVSLIKMDIEGSELSTLAGARDLIQHNTPVLAISAYHRQEDLWDIPIALKELNKDYSIYLRPHLREGWDLVCYAVPSSRCG